MVWERHRLYLADHIWLIGHDEVDGKSRVSDTAMGLALAGCLMGELACRETIELTPTQDVKISDNASRPRERLAHTLLQQIHTETTRTEGVTNVRDWLTYVSQFANTWVVNRLLDLSLIQPIQTRTMFRKTIRHRVVNTNRTVQHGVQITGKLRDRAPLDKEELAVIGFCDAAGLTRWLLQDDSPAVRNNLQRQQELLRWPLSSLVAETKAAIGDAVLAHRA